MFMNENLEHIWPQPWAHGEIWHPSNIFELWSDAELASVGIYRVQDGAINPPAGKVFERFEYAIVGHVAIGTPVYVDAPVPQVIEGWQAEVVMRLFEVSPGVSLWDAVQAAIDQMQDPAQQLTARTVLARGRLRRDSPLLAQISDELSLTETQIDTLFIQADALEA